MTRRLAPLPGRALLTATLVLSLAVVVCLLAAAPSRGAELVYWDNYKAEPQTIGFASLDGSGGGALNLTGVTLDGPEGMAIDTVTGRLYVASCCGGPGKKGEILFANLDGSGAGVFSAPGAPVDEPFGVAIDPATRMIYWANGAEGEANGSIAWAKLDGSAGGVLNAAGTVVDDPYKLALDPVNGRVYFGSYPATKPVISYVNVDNSGGGTLNLNGYVPESAYAFAVDQVAGRVYWSDGPGGDKFAYTGLLGGTVSFLNTSPAVRNTSYGFAIDPTLGRIYWPNYDNNANRVNGLGFASLSGGGGGNITPLVAPFDGPQDTLILKSPTATAAPGVTRAKNDRAKMTCSTGGWAADFAGSYVYQAPTTYGYQWLRNGKAVSGATAATLNAKSAGKFTCTVTAANQAGVAAQTSAAVKVEASKAKLTTKKKVTVKSGGAATFPVKVANQGDIKSKNAKLCVILPKASKAALKAPKCKSLGKLKGKGKKSAKLKIKTLPSASGVYSVTFKVKGSAGKPAKAKVQVK